MQTKFFQSVGLLCFFLVGVCAFAESVYVVDHGSGVFSFDVVSNELVFRDQVSVPTGAGVDIAVDDEAGILFRTMEFSPYGIDLINAETLEYIKTVTFPVSPNTGIVYDAANSRLLCTKRNTNQLYIILWDPTLQTLTYQSPTITLSQVQHACDLAINGDTLYVSEYLYQTGGSAPTSQNVYAYDMSDDFAYIETIDMMDYTISIDYNATDDCVYGTSWYDDKQILKRTFDPNTVYKNIIGYHPIGIATNSEQSGRVFITTYRDGGTIEMWDMSETDPNDYELVDVYGNNEPNGPSLSGLAGIVVSSNFIESVLTLEKFDDANDCLSIGDEVTYTLEWENPTDETAYVAYIIDYLPDGVTYEGGFWALDPNLNLIPPDPGYYPEEHAYVWDMNTLAPYSSGSVELTVKVNDKAEPGMTLLNKAVLTSSFGTTMAVLDTTPICCFDTGTTIYVDQNATGNNNGTNWTDAYTTIQQAIRRINESTCQVTYENIYVAQGTYIPGYNASDRFLLPDGISMYGGFPMGGSDFGDRKPKKYQTLLTANSVSGNDVIVQMGDEALLDGFSVTKSEDQCVYGNGVDFTVENCRIENSDEYGVRAIDGDVTIKWCFVQNNIDGILHTGEGYILTVENSQIRKNMRYGIFSQNSTPSLKNCVVSESDLSEEGREGIRMINPTDTPVLYNNTFAHNRGKGVFFTDDGTVSDPNARDWPDIQNCVLWHNNSGNEQFSGFSKSHIYYSCVYDPNDPNGMSLTLDANYNFSANPKLAYFDPNNVHLAYDSPCKDNGNPVFDVNDLGAYDMDSEDRIVGSIVDIGADELYSCDGDYTEDDFHNDLDWNADGVVNLVEFSRFQKAWLSHDPNDSAWLADPNLADPNLSDPWNPLCNLDPNGTSAYVIDLADLQVFWADTPWLWEACWRDNYIEMYGMMSGGGESMMMAPMMETMSAESTEFIVDVDYEADLYSDMSSPELALFVKGIYEIVDSIDSSIREGHENAENLAEAKEFLEDVLDDIRASMQ